MHGELPLAKNKTNAGDTLCIPRFSGECTAGVIQNFRQPVTEKLSRAGKAGNLPGGLLPFPTIILSLFIRVMISLSTIYYKYASYYLILQFLCIKYAVIERI